MSNKFNINALTQKHSLGLTDDVKYIREVVFVDEQKFLDEFDNLDPIVQHITFYYNNKPIACCRYFKADDNNNNSYQIGRIAVLKEYRGNGIGKHILYTVEQLLKEKGANKLILSAQTRAKDFYKKCGYTETGTTYYEEYCEHIKMFKEL